MYILLLIYLRGNKRIAHQKGNIIVEQVNRNGLFSSGRAYSYHQFRKSKRQICQNNESSMLKSEKTGHLARSTTYKKTGNRSSMDHKKSSWSDARTLWEISSKVCWMTLSLSDGVNVVLLKKKKAKRYPIIFLAPLYVNCLTGYPPGTHVL